MSIEVPHEAIESHKKLAQVRTILANERNTLAYIRTGFSSFLLGFGLVEFLGDDIRFSYLGWGGYGTWRTTYFIWFNLLSNT